MNASTSKARLITGWVITAVPVLFLLVDGLMKLIKPRIVIDTTVQLGYSEGVILWLGVVLLACTLLHLIPQTSVLGAILLTGYLGGAVATHVRVTDPGFAILFPVMLAVFIWGGLCLREPRVNKIVPLLPTGVLR